MESSIDNDLYIGSTKNLKERIEHHNKGEVKSTKAYKPWNLLGWEEYNSRSEAVKRERFLKQHQQKEILKKKYGVVAK